MKSFVVPDAPVAEVVFISGNKVVGVLRFVFGVAVHKGFAACEYRSQHHQGQHLPIMRRVHWVKDTA